MVIEIEIDLAPMTSRTTSTDLTPRETSPGEQRFLNFLSFENVTEHQDTDFGGLIESFKRLDTDKLQARRSFTLQLEQQEKFMMETDLPILSSVLSAISEGGHLRSPLTSPLGKLGPKKMSFSVFES